MLIRTPCVSLILKYIIYFKGAKFYLKNWTKYLSSCSLNSLYCFDLCITKKEYKGVFFRYVDQEGTTFATFAVYCRMTVITRRKSLPRYQSSGLRREIRRSPKALFNKLIISLAAWHVAPSTNSDTKKF